jgi:SAM-dependent methyltransferase
VLAGVPLLVPAPTDYLAGYRDAVLATLASHGAADRATVAQVAALADAGARSEPLAFGDDWVNGEVDADADAPAPAVRGPGAAELARFLALAAGQIEDALVALLPPAHRRVVELGVGAGVLTRRLAAVAGVEELVVADLSLRAALRASRPVARRRAVRARAAIAAVVLDADALPIAARTVDAIIAAELVDLLATPARFLADARRALRRGGRLILSTPDPALGTSDADHLAQLLRRADWKVVAHRAGVPWVRAHSARHFQIYASDVIAAKPA